MKVALTAEGTYPYQPGGVSVWCDQLIRGMPDREFEIVALVATGAEPLRWTLPRNVASVTAIPIWGPATALPSRRRRAGSDPPVDDLIAALLSPEPDAALQFAAVLRKLFEFAQRHSLSGYLASEDAVRLLSRAWRGLASGDPHGIGPNLHDAVTAMQLLEHALRPLAYPPATADVAHAVTNGLGVLPALAAKWRDGTPLLVTEHGIYMREQYLHSREFPYRWPVRALYLKFLRYLCAVGYQEAELITPGNAFNERWELRLGASAGQVRTIYNGVTAADFPVIEDEPEVPTISWAGRIDPVKDLETLIIAFALVHGKMPDARLRIFGSPPPGRDSYLESCRTLASDLGVAESVSFEGRVDEIRDAYVAGHVVVLCSITEGFPFTLIEAMTCGRPCVATDVGGVPEAIADTGLVVPPRNSEALAESCLTLLRDGDLRRRLGTAARNRVLEYFTVDRALAAFDEIYARLAAGRPLPASDPLPATTMRAAAGADPVGPIGAEATP